MSVTTLQLRHSTATFRHWGTTPEMLIEHGCSGGAAYIVGRTELEAVAKAIKSLLAEPKPTATPAPRHKRWTPELQMEVITRHDGGESYASIGRSLGISRSWARMMIRLIRQRRARAAQGQAT